MSEVHHDVCDTDSQVRVDGPDPGGRTHASFSDPDGNGWILKEVTERLPGR
ncbi:VOC family protein [Streptomyces shenzhenensis]|uniref:hypothetical protein n=1 Tax=Streptomyces shenzhenensis TaxID=943815 RepID=UPI0015F0AF4D|nr:hypothetical protein [Streptomyces shenzhenensis]